MSRIRFPRTRRAGFPTGPVYPPASRCEGIHRAAWAPGTSPASNACPLSRSTAGFTGAGALGILLPPLLLLLLVVLVLSGCATAPVAGTVAARRFAFEQDTFAYANELVWEYRFDERGRWTSRPRVPEPDYTHHCFVVARAAKQFFAHARFEPDRPAPDAATCRRLVRQVMARCPSRISPEDWRIVIPGYANLRQFSAAHEALLKAECGGAWRSYFQHGHWRMIWPFSRRHQARMAEQMVAELEHNRPAVVHLVCFPSLKINHAVLLFDCSQSDGEIRFATYDPNAPGRPVTLTYNRGTRSFSLPQNFYFPGGRVDVYEIYRSLCY